MGKQKKSRKKWFFGFLLLFTAIFLSLPTLLSTDLGNKLTIGFVNRFSAGSLAIESFSLRWLGPQEAHRLDYKDSTIVFCSEHLEMTGSLFALLKKPYALDTVTLTNWSASLAAPPLLPKEEVQTASLWTLDFSLIPTLPFSGRITSKGGCLSTMGFYIEALEGSIEAQGELACQLQGSIRYKETTGSLFIDGKAQYKDAAALSLKTSLVNFPAEGVDDLLLVFAPQYREFGKELFGRSFTLDCLAAIDPNRCEVSLTLQSDNLQARMQLASKEGVASLLSPAFATLKITPALVPSLTAPLPIKVTLDSLNLAIGDTGPDFLSAAFSGKITSSAYPISSALQGDLTTTFSSQKLASELLTNTVIALTAKKQTANLLINAAFKEPLSPTPSIALLCELDKLPIEALFFIKEAPTFLGSWVEGSFSLQGQMHDLQGQVHLNAPLLKISDTSFSWKKGALALLAPSLIQYQIPEQIGEEIILHNPPTFTASIEKLSATPSSLKELLLKAEIPALTFTKLFKASSYTLSSLYLECDADTLSNINLSLKGNDLSLFALLALQENGSLLVLKKPLEFSYEVKDQDLNFLPLDRPHLLANSNVHLTLNPTKISLPLASHKLTLEGDISSPAIRLEHQKKEIHLEKGAAHFAFSGKKDALALDSTINILSPEGDSGVIQASCLYQEALLQSAQIEVKHLPTPLLDSFFPISSLLGRTLDGTATFTQEKAQKSFVIEVQSPLLLTRGTLVLDEEEGMLSKGSPPFTFNYTLTKEGYKQLVPLLSLESPFTLMKDALFQSSILSLSLPYKALDIKNLLIQAELTIPEFSLERQDTKEAISLQNTKLSLKKKSLEKAIACKLDSTMLPQGSLHLEGKLDGDLTPSDLVTSFQLSAKQMPSSFLDAFSQKNIFHTLLGSSFDLEGNFSLHEASGPFAFTLSSQGLQTSCKGELYSGILKLKENAKLSLLLTEEVSQIFLKESSSLKAIYASKPIQIEIDAKGFSVPLLGYSPTRLIAPNILIDLGKIHCKSEGGVNDTLKLLKSKEQKGEDLEFWFAPSLFHVSQGIVEIERTEILINKTYDVAFWGVIDLPSNYANAILGLTAQTLEGTLGLKGLPQDYVLKIPVKGPLDNISINTGVATSKIAALMLWKNKLVQKGLGPFGNLLEVIPPPGGEGSTPPKKSPLPWES